MFDTRFYKIFYDLIGSKTRTILIVLSIAVGLFAVGTIISAREILSSEMTRSYASINPSSGIVSTVELFDSSFIQAARSVKGVGEVDARRAIHVRAQVNDGNWFDMQIYAVDDFNKMTVNKILPNTGAWPPPDRQVLIERSAVPAVNANIGDTLTIQLGNNQKKSMRIAGSALDMVQAPFQINQIAFGYVNFKTVDWLGEPYGFNELQVISSDQSSKAAAREVINHVKDRAERNGFTIPLSMVIEPGQLPMNDILQAILMMMGLIGILSLLLSVFLIINTISALLAQQKRQIGVMKAIGAGSLQVIQMYLSMVLVYGLVALLISMPLSIYGANLLSQMMADFFNFTIRGGRISIPALAMMVVVGVLVPVLASLYPFLASLRVTAAEALSTFGQGGKSARKNWIDHLLSGANLWFARRVLVRPVLLSLRNTFRSQGRLVLTLVTLTTAGAIFISVFNARTSIYSAMDSLVQMWNFDVMVNLDNNYPVEKISAVSLAVPNVTAVDVWEQYPAHVVRADGSEGESIYMFAPRADSDLVRSPEITAGRWIVPADENAIVVNTIFTKNEGVTLGDTVTLKINGHKYPFKIIGVTLGMGASEIFGNFDYMARITNSSGKANTALVSFDSLNKTGDSLYHTVQDLQDHMKSQGIHSVDAQTMVDQVSSAQGTFDVIIWLLMFMAALLAAVGGLGLMGTMSINVLERTREIGVLRAIGAPNRGVSRVFIQEGITIGVISWFFSILVSFPLSLALNTMVGTSVLGDTMPLNFSIEGVLAWLAIVIVLSALASFLPARSASRLTVREVLAYE